MSFESACLQSRGAPFYPTDACPRTHAGLKRTVPLLRFSSPFISRLIKMGRVAFPGDSLVTGRAVFVPVISAPFRGRYRDRRFLIIVPSSPIAIRNPPARAAGRGEGGTVKRISMEVPSKLRPRPVLMERFHSLWVAGPRTF